MAPVPRPSEPEPLGGHPRFLALVGLGGNLGDVPAALASAAQALDALPLTRVIATSSLYRTKPVDAGGPDFLNAVLALGSALAPGELMRALLCIETRHDRERPFPHAPRTLDLDLLWYGGASRHSVPLMLPHPRMQQRAFVLEPLAEVLAQLPPALVPSAHPELPVLPPGAERHRLAQLQGISAAGAFPWAVQHAVSSV